MVTEDIAFEPEFSNVTMELYEALHETVNGWSIFFKERIYYDFLKDFEELRKTENLLEIPAFA